VVITIRILLFIALGTIPEVIDPLHDDVSFWHDYNRSGTLTFKVKMAGFSRYNPTMQSAAGLFWFLMSSCFRLIRCEVPSDTPITDIHTITAFQMIILI